MMMAMFSFDGLQFVGNFLSIVENKNVFRVFTNDGKNHNPDCKCWFARGWFLLLTSLYHVCWNTDGWLRSKSRKAGLISWCGKKLEVVASAPVSVSGTGKIDSHRRNSGSAKSYVHNIYLKNIPLCFTNKFYWKIIMSLIRWLFSTCKEIMIFLGVVQIFTPHCESNFEIFKSLPFSQGLKSKRTTFVVVASVCLEINFDICKVLENPRTFE